MYEVEKTQGSFRIPKPLKEELADIDGVSKVDISILEIP